MSGRLYIVATPIGNLGDITFRAVETLKAVSLILAEDTRVSRKLLIAYSISTPLLSNFTGNEGRRTEEVIAKLKDGEDIALITDAGTPSISDPGFLLVKACRDHGLEVIPVPGASSLSTAVSVSGLQDHPLLFFGFAPKKESERRNYYAEIKNLSYTIAFFESPQRIKRFLTELYETFPERNIFIGREMTKKFESYLVNPSVDEVPEKGEFVVMLSPPKEGIKILDPEQIKAEFDKLVEEGSLPKNAVKILAKSCKMPKRLLYNMLLVKDGEIDSE
jgi:16S rRNA (cytidine1402-2'-O)-methyltransferase